MGLLRRSSTGRLLLLAAATAVAVALGAGIAVAAGAGAGSRPPAASLADAVHAALSAPRPAGVSGRLEFTNRLLASGALGGGGSSPLLTGAHGRFWATADGRLRLELQGADGNGDVEVLDDGSSLQVYDVATNTLYRAELPARPAEPSPARTIPSAAQIQGALDKLAGALTVAGPTSTTAAGQGAYEVRLAPKSGGGLLGGVALAWDALHGVPLRLAVYARSDPQSPVLELAATDVSLSAVPPADVQLAPAAGAHVVDLGALPARGTPAGGSKPQPVTGASAVAARLPFALVAPASLAGRPQSEVRLVHLDGKPAALVLYGSGLDAVAVLESQQAPATGGRAAGALASLPPVRLAAGVSGRELPTALGTLVRFDRGGVAFTVAASQPEQTVVEAARTLAGS